MDPIDTLAAPIDALAHPIDALAHPIDALAHPIDALADPIDALAAPPTIQSHHQRVSRAACASARRAMPASLRFPAA